MLGRALRDPNNDGMHPGISSYAIPTKVSRHLAMRLDAIRRYVRTFPNFARSPSDLEFTPIGCGLAGYKPEQIAPMFAGAPDNCTLPAEFQA
jgi:hypothetical protein